MLELYSLRDEMILSANDWLRKHNGRYDWVREVQGRWPLSYTLNMHLFIRTLTEHRL